MKTLILIRHAWAGNSADFKKHSQKIGLVMGDDARPIDARGRAEMRQMVKGLKFLLKDSQVILSSPLVRARQTAEIIQKGLKRKRHVKIEELVELRPEVPARSTWQAIQKYKHHDQVVLVGHEPHFAKFLSFILTGDTLHPLPFKKGGVAVVELVSSTQRRALESSRLNAAKNAKGELRCFIQPTHMRKIRKS
jgi:phosphohistidine phosphatase